MKIQDAIQVITSASGGVAANFEALKKLYKKAALNCHPDRNADADEVTMIGLNAAWGLLSANAEQVETILGRSGFRSSEDDIESNALTHSTLPAFKSRESLLREAFCIVDDMKWGDWIDARFKTVYFSQYHLRIHTYQNCIRIYELTNALETRKSCTVYNIHWGLGDDCEGYSRFLNWAASINTASCVTGVIAHLSVADYKEKRLNQVEAELAKGLYVTKYEEKSGKVFSPFKLHKLAPLSSLPDKLRHQHLVKLIANGQYRQLIRSQYLTDDYAYDAATNFGRKVYENPFNLLQDLIEDKSSCFYLFSGSSKDGEYSFGDHSNDSKSIIPVISNRFPAIDLIDGENQKLALQ